MNRRIVELQEERFVARQAIELGGQRIWDIRPDPRCAMASPRDAAPVDAGCVSCAQAAISRLKTGGTVARFEVPQVPGSASSLIPSGPRR
jgi:hypothetical protein